MEPKTIKRMIVAAVVVAGLVFGVTFLAQYLHTAKPPDNQEPGKPREEALLVFDHEKWPTFIDQKPPPPDQPPAANAEIGEEIEWGQEGWHDYEFRSTKDEPVDVALLRKACTCSRVQIAWGPKEGRQWQELDQGDPKVGGREPVTVTLPARAEGTVRLYWKAESKGVKVENRGFYADIVSRTPDIHGKLVRLEAGVTYVEPILISTPGALMNGRFESNTAALGTLGEGVDATADFLCWSCTRPDFEMHTRDDALVTWEGQTKLPPSDRNGLQRSIHRHVKCAYRVTARFRSKDLGPFTHAVELPTEPPVTVLLGGTVKGAVIVKDEGKETSSIELGNFPSSAGTDRTVQIEAPLDVELKVPEPQKDDFLRVEEVSATAADNPPGSAVRRWTLTVSVVPNKVYGPFGSGAGAVREGTIVLDVLKNNQRSQQLRITVNGNATAR